MNTLILVHSSSLETIKYSLKYPLISINIFAASEERQKLLSGLSVKIDLYNYILNLKSAINNDTQEIRNAVMSDYMHLKKEGQQIIDGKVLDKLIQFNL